MAQQKPEKLNLSQVLQLVDQLSADDQAKLRAVLLEDQEDIRIADERLKSPGKRWTQEELEQDLDLAN